MLNAIANFAAGLLMTIRGGMEIRGGRGGFLTKPVFVNQQIGIVPGLGRKRVAVEDVLLGSAADR